MKPLRNQSQLYYLWTNIVKVQGIITKTADAHYPRDARKADFSTSKRPLLNYMSLPIQTNRWIYKTLLQRGSKP